MPRWLTPTGSVDVSLALACFKISGDGLASCVSCRDGQSDRQPSSNLAHEFTLSFSADGDNRNIRSQRLVT